MMASAQPLWWFALPLLLLPIWWHRQKRQRIKSEPLATARFLPAAPPQTVRIWRWEDLLLLALRCLFLIALIGWLAAVSMPWRGDTVFIDPALTAREQAAAALPARGPAAGPASPAQAAASASYWIEQQVAAAGMSGAQRIALPANALQWLQANEHAWRPGARLLILAQSIPMPAQLPPLAHMVDIRVLPPVVAAADRAAATAADRAATAATAGRAAPATASAAAAGRAATGAAAAPATGTAAAERPEHRIALSAPPEHLAAWRATFAAFESAGHGRYIIEDKPGAGTGLIVWDSQAAPPPGWHAPLWWLPASAPLAALGAREPLAKPLTINGLTLQITDSPRGRLWLSPALPPQNADAARALYETWQSLTRPAQPYPLPAQQLPPRRSTPLAMPGTPPAAWLAYLLLALFALERLITHARRR
ncbi:hypothetical protein ASC94_30445 [Massilia sp. Root418]|jgi:hypothetical protein|uniref:BatA domain-containing protein n=1 Tax=Massilia sp. Root418 TaxID=1736532 RepID=UPI0006F71F99|nr:BatA domain-containing protein [Massilia sp. Root418]KQX00202.1 hypothetical protein ASC94_30445 [Massilia sp. Root418]